jgi:asparagine synthase (glutamine-hydrolysing)
VRAEKLTYLSTTKLRNLEEAVATIEAEGVEGDLVEAGIALGGSGIVLATLAGPDRRFRGYDVFGMIPAPSERDDPKSHARYRTIASGESRGLGGETYYGYRHDLYGQVAAAFERHGLPVDGDRIQLHRGLFADTLRFDPTDRVALAHIDCDWHDPVKLCLERLYPVLQPGGYLISDDYHDYGGCRAAVDDFLGRHSELVVERREGSLVMRRAPAGSQSPR